MRNNKNQNKNKGFSLVELIVVIAIMAVMAAVLAPALLGYVEKSRMQKDSSAMGEITNSVQLAIADQNIYDELIVYAVKGNYSCYVDGDTSTNTDANKIITKAPDLWLYNDNCRLLDEVAYKPAGSMRGVTITLRPNGTSEYVLKDGIVNQMGNASTKKGDNGGKALSDTSFQTLYNQVRSTVGDTLKVSSQTYRNSDYTIFISMGTTGGNQADAQDAIKVYGQYNGTNLPEVVDADAIEGGTQDKGFAGTEIVNSESLQNLYNSIQISCGDLNFSGTVDILDYTLFGNIYAGTVDFSTKIDLAKGFLTNSGYDVSQFTESELLTITKDCLLTAADANADGIVNKKDEIKFKNHLFEIVFISGQTNLKHNLSVVQG